MVGCVGCGGVCGMWWGVWDVVGCVRCSRVCGMWWGAWDATASRGGQRWARVVAIFYVATDVGA